MKVKTILPLFNGFYNTILSGGIDNVIEEIITNHNEENGTNLNYENFNFVINWEGYSKKIAEHIIDYIKEELPTLVNEYRFEALFQPREYNFSTDEIQIELDFNKDALLDIMTEHSIMLKEKIKEKFTSRSGFISFVSNDYFEWLNAIVHYDKENDYTPIMVAHIIQFVLEDNYHNDDVEWSIVEKCEVYNLVN